MEKNLNLTPQQKMTLWAVWSYAKSRTKADDGGADGAEDHRGPVITAKAIKGRYQDRFDLALKDKELDALADKRVLREDAEAGDGCYRMAKREAVEAAYAEVEGEYAGG